MTYFTSSIALKGKIKHRYSDFIVQEVSLDGEINRILPENQQEEIQIPENKENKDFLHCTLQKTNTDLQNAIKRLCLNLQCGKSRIGFAGLKDKRAITSQRISIYQPNVSLLQKFNQNMVKIFDFSWQDKKIDLGDLQENRFTITIRNVNKEENEIKKIIEQFQKEIKNGIPNAFGEQRFGGIRQITHKVGKLFLQERFKEAVLLYLAYCHGEEDDQTKEARTLAGEEKYKESFKKFKGNNFRYERAILNALIKSPNDFVGAFQQMPKNLLILFTHAYQSYLFNIYLEKRYEKFGKNMFEEQKGDITDEKGNVLGPLFGFDFEFAQGESEEIEKEILESEKISLEAFRSKSFPQLGARGGRRQIKLEVKNIISLEMGKDEFFEGSNYLKISFSLTKASYATVVLEELMKLRV